EAMSRVTFGALVLDERPAPPSGKEIADRLFREAKTKGAAAFVEDAEAYDRLARRTAFAASSFPESGIAAIDAALLDTVLRELSEGKRSFRELREAGVLETLRYKVDPSGKLDALAPESVMLPGGRRVRVNYESGQPPWIESRLQDFFGMAQGPSL